MKRNNASTTLGIVLATTFVVSVAVTAHAEDHGCSSAGAAGSYAFSDSGTIVGVGPRAALALLTLDAAGNIKGPVTASLNGTVTNTTLSGTYTVNPDCTGRISFVESDQSGKLLLTGTVAAIWDNNMRELRFLFTSAVLSGGTSVPTVINGNARKLED